MSGLNEKIKLYTCAFVLFSAGNARGIGSQMHPPQVAQASQHWSWHWVPVKNQREKTCVYTKICFDFFQIVGHIYCHIQLFKCLPHTYNSSILLYACIYSYIYLYVGFSSFFCVKVVYRGVGFTIYPKIFSNSSPSASFFQMLKL